MRTDATQQLHEYLTFSHWV